MNAPELGAVWRHGVYQIHRSSDIVWRLFRREWRGVPKLQEEGACQAELW